MKHFSTLKGFNKQTDYFTFHSLCQKQWHFLLHLHSSKLFFGFSSLPFTHTFLLLFNFLSLFQVFYLRSLEFFIIPFNQCNFPNILLPLHLRYCSVKSLRTTSCFWFISFRIFLNITTRFLNFFLFSHHN